MTKATAPLQTARLDAIVRDIKSECRKSFNAAKQSLGHAMNIGDLLNEAKGLVRPPLRFAHLAPGVWGMSQRHSECDRSERSRRGATA
jgi:hypothetical protein